MALKLISRADLARLAKVSKAAVTKALKGRLAPARIGDRVNAAHPVVRAWLASRRAAATATDGAPTVPTKRTRKRPAPPTKVVPVQQNAPQTPTDDRPKLPDEEPPPPLAEVDAFLAVLGPLAQKFSTARAFKDWLSGLEGLERYRKQRLDNDERRGRVVSRELVEGQIFGFLEATFKRLLNDTPRTLAREVSALLKSGTPVEDVERAIRENVTSQLEPVKAHVVQALRNAS